MSDPLWQRLETLEHGTETTELERRVAANEAFLEAINKTLNIIIWVVGACMLASALALIAAWPGA